MNLQIAGLTPDRVMDFLGQLDPELPDVIGRVQSRVPFYKRAVAPYQGAALYHLVKRYNWTGSHILEIGTAWGFTAAFMAEACPLAEIITLNPKAIEVPKAREHLKPYPNVRVLQITSQEYLLTYDGPRLDFIMVDGAHDIVYADLPWYNWLRPGGMILFHDYTPEWGRRPTPVVYDTLNSWRENMGRDFDVRVIDDGETGMVGYISHGPVADSIFPPAPKPPKIAT